jgi:hypothetical protein
MLGLAAGLSLAQLKIGPHDAAICKEQACRLH